ncbi:polysaccharide biosynthesis protein [Nostoc cf. commune SO-36]|uniref:Polysaccharide biosynthesis protein n=1 Tax=Nostoc cf. commune SO-36 TaxID=449208 RepID=A0ABN6Q7T4_NOSCO|nr:glycosyltransferase [Nostoc commune]BDI19243.1 polysaccharide biosynthesis protein [Nostoc cf. commune SO-36]
MKALIVTCHLPTDNKTDKHGWFKRLEIFIDALTDISEIHILYYFNEGQDNLTLEKTAQIEINLSSRINKKVILSLCPYKMRGSLVKKVIDLLFIFYDQKRFFSSKNSLETIALKEKLQTIKPDIIFFSRLPSIVPALGTESEYKFPTIFFDIDDVTHTDYYKRLWSSKLRYLSNSWESVKSSPFFFFQVLHKQLLLSRAVAISDLTFVCSEIDRKYISEKFNDSQVKIVPNAVIIPAKKSSLPSNPNLLFLGNYDRSPNNVIGANFLIEEIWPLIYQQHPEARLIIAGKSPDNIRTYTDNIPGVEFTGFVTDINALYDQTRVVCCPILSGGGTRLKIIEAAAYGKPIVSTTVGAEGLEMIDGREYMLRDQPEDFAQACLELFRNDFLCEELGNQARAAAIKHYDRDCIINLIQEYLQQL